MTRSGYLAISAIWLRVADVAKQKGLVFAVLEENDRNEPCRSTALNCKSIVLPRRPNVVAAMSDSQASRIASITLRIPGGWKLASRILARIKSRNTSYFDTLT